MSKLMAEMARALGAAILTALIQISSCSSGDKPEPMFADADEEIIINEGKSYTGTIWINKKSGYPIQIGLVTENDKRSMTGASSNDYKLHPKTIEFKAGENEQHFTVEALEDSLVEGQEIVIIKLFNIEEMEEYKYYGASSGRNQIVIMINDITPHDKKSEDVPWVWP